MTRRKSFITKRGLKQIGIGRLIFRKQITVKELQQIKPTTKKSFYLNSLDPDTIIEAAFDADGFLLSADEDLEEVIGVVSDVYREFEGFVELH